VALALVIVTGLAGAETLFRWSFGSLGGVAALLGLTLLVNLNGAADHLTSSIKTNRFWGIDYSQSLMANPLFVRIFGAGFVVVGCMFVMIPLTTRNL
jgi:hypothetical protein